MGARAGRSPWHPEPFPSPLRTSSPRPLPSPDHGPLSPAHPHVREPPERDLALLSGLPVYVDDRLEHGGVSVVGARDGALEHVEIDRLVLQHLARVRKAEVDQHDATVVPDEHVRRREVPVDQAVVVEPRNGPAEVRQDRGQLHGRERVGEDEGLERWRGNVLHEDARPR